MIETITETDGQHYIKATAILQLSETTRGSAYVDREVNAFSWPHFWVTQKLINLMAARAGPSNLPPAPDAAWAHALKAIAVAWLCGNEGDAGADVAYYVACGRLGLSAQPFETAETNVLIDAIAERHQRHLDAKASIRARTFPLMKKPLNPRSHP